ncbi:ATP-binding cassette domain-containing protein [Polyangium jinanense]|uniref:ATP-binding cassette domain-containing protein n=1 Tax=Polyangium jinanense TaxID=2829994 RepID=A0A9X3X7D6_9BACT|nr:ATP-binding cassette domain-containing protein [Polyangium jinanense]MDC3956630.1 ATP-binding cassette domain-containing protein [Polyangium jinanense]MDC3985587.1 ATP-binding cassette domain-containing protein [Polyangium jinanense]
MTMPRSPMMPPPRLLLEGIHARDAAAPRGASRGSLAGLNLALGAGVFAVLGAPEDGTLALSEVISGARAPLHGRVLIEGQSPARSPLLRARIGALAAEPTLPDARTVEACVALSRKARGESTTHAGDVLDPFGLGHLARREPRSLSFAEARAVELALALTTPSPLLVSLHEPLSDVALNLLGLVRERIRALALGGACVVVTTSSPADARALGDRVLVLHKGIVLGEADAAEPLPGGEPALVAWVRPADDASERSPVRVLARLLSDRPEVRAVAWSEAAGPYPQAAELRLSGEDLDACALALTDAAVEAGVVIEAVAPASPGIVQVRAAAEALLTFRRAAGLAQRPPVALPAARSARVPGALAPVAPEAVQAVPSEAPAAEAPPVTTDIAEKPGDPGEPRGGL